MSNLASSAARNLRNQKPVGASAPMNNSLVRMANSFNSGVDKLNTQVQSGFTTVSNTVRNTVTNTAKAMNLPTTIPALSAPTVPKNIFANTAATVGSVGSSLSSMFTGARNGSNAPRNASTNLFSTASRNTSGNASSVMTSALAWPLAIFAVLVMTFSFLLYYFMSEIKAGYENLVGAIRSVMGANSAPPVPIIIHAPPPTTNTPPDVPETHSEMETQTIVEKVLPLNGPPEVFNISKNDFNYYDAEPLCKALGAELATYEQVKDAYSKGADWCNYGWVKGQVAVYPTQQATWDQLQKSNDEDRNACGRPGVNGGYFDNPDMKFGVNCYGPKPSQSAHDEAKLMKSGRIPKTTAGLKIQQKVQEFEAQADELGLLPFNKNKWGSS